MSEFEAGSTEAAAVRSNCPQCSADLTILRVIPGRAGSEYWALRCTRCGGIHLDIVNAVPRSPVRIH